MHVFLTGKRRAGKSTVVNQVLKDVAVSKNPMTAGGFRTVYADDENGRKLYMIKADGFSEEASAGPHAGKTVVAEVHNGVPAADTAGFNEAGCRILRESKGRDLIIMDELGFLEKDAAAFRQAVFDVLDGDTPVLGVLREGYPGWTGAIARRCDVMVIEVTPGSREGLSARIREILFPGDTGEACRHTLKLSAVVMASGRSVRFRGEKLRAPVGGVPMIERLFRSIPKGLFETVAVVSGDEMILNLAECSGFLPVVNRDDTNDTAVTIRRGMESIPSDSGGCMFFVGDQPCLTAESIKGLAETFARNPDKICVLSHNGKKGNPVVFPQTLFASLGNLAPGEKGKDVMKRSGIRIVTHEAKDAIELEDVDYVSDLIKISSKIR